MITPLSSGVTPEWTEQDERDAEWYRQLADDEAKCHPAVADARRFASKIQRLRIGMAEQRDDLSSYAEEHEMLRILLGCPEEVATLEQARLLISELERLRAENAELRAAATGDPEKFRKLVLDACFDLGYHGLNADNPEAAASLASLVANASRLGAVVDRERHEAEIASLRALLSEKDEDTKRLDWLEAHAREGRENDEAQIRVEFIHGMPGVPGATQESGFYFRQWGETPYDDEGEPDYRRRDYYQSPRFATLREALDAALVGRSPETPADG